MSFSCILYFTEMIKVFESSCVANFIKWFNHWAKYLLLTLSWWWFVTFLMFFRYIWWNLWKIQEIFRWNLTESQHRHCDYTELWFTCTQQSVTHYICSWIGTQFWIPGKYLSNVCMLKYSQENNSAIILYFNQTSLLYFNQIYFQTYTIIISWDTRYVLQNNLLKYIKWWWHSSVIPKVTDSFS